MLHLPNYEMNLRMTALKSMEGKEPQLKADILNMLEEIITGELSVNEIVDRFDNGTLPETYIVKKD